MLIVLFIKAKIIPECFLQFLVPAADIMIDYIYECTHKSSLLFFSKKVLFLNIFRDYLWSSDITGNFSITYIHIIMSNNDTFYSILMSIPMHYNTNCFSNITILYILF